MIEQILSRLDKVKSRGQNTWMASCPAHQDSDPSLAIKELPDGRILMKCFAGCEALNIVHAIGLELKDLFPQNGVGNFKSLSTEYKHKKQIRESVEKAKTVWSIYEADRQRGTKINKNDRELVMDAYQTLKDNNEL